MTTSLRSRPGLDDAALFSALAGQGGGAASCARQPLAGAGLSAGPGLFYWAPVFLALAVFAHFALLGLRPALRESARLDAAEGLLLDRREREEARALKLERILRAQRDPIYLEREKRLLLDPAAGLLGR